MKFLSASLMTMIMLASVSLSAQEIPSDVIKALNGGNASALSPYMAEHVVMIMDEHSTSLTDVTVVQALTSFFELHRVFGFKVNHQDKRSHSCFVIGTLATSKGLYRVNCFFRRRLEKYEIHQIRIEKIKNE